MTRVNGKNLRALLGSSSPVLDRPAALLGEPSQLAVRIHRDRLVGPFERRLVGHVIGIESNVPVRAFEA